MRKKIIQLLIFCVLFSGFPFSSGTLTGQEKAKQGTVRKKRLPQKSSRKKPKARKKRPANKAPRGKTRPKTGKKRPVKKQTSKKASARKRPPNQSAKKRRPPSRRKKPAPSQAKPTKAAPTKLPPNINAGKLSTELYALTEKLESSTRQLAHATSYLEPYNRKQIIKIDSRNAPVPLQKLEQNVFANPDDVKGLRDLGLRYENEERYEDAKDVYLRAIARHPENPDHHYYLGRIYQLTGQTTLARQAYEEALEIDPSHTATLNALSVINGRPAEPKNEYYDEKTTTTRDSPGGKIEHLRDLLSDRKYEDVIRYADEALEVFPDQSSIYYLKGLAYEELGESAAAKSAYQKAIHLDSKNADAHIALANHYFSEGKYIYAALSFGDAVMLNPGDKDSRYMEGLAYYNASEWKRAVRSWEKLYRVEPGHPLLKVLLPQTYYLLAVEYNRMGESQKGRKAFQQALTINNNTGQWLPGAYRALGNYYRNLGLYNESLSAFQEAVELRPNDAVAFLGLGITYWRMQEPLLAKAAWKRSLEINPENNEAQGWLLIAANDSN